MTSRNDLEWSLKKILKFFIYFRSSLGERVNKDEEVKYTTIGSGNRQMSFSTKPIPKDARKREVDMRKHREDRKRVIRPITSLRLKKYIPR